MHPAQLPIEQLLTRCGVRRGRRSGPGGQHRNKVETAIVIEHTPTGVRAEATERRSQEQNRRQAVFRLRVNLALEVRITEPGPPSSLWRERCRGGRISVSASHDDFPALLAEVLDHVELGGGDVAGAAKTLGATTSQLVKLLKLEPRALARANVLRLENGFKPLK